MSYVAERLDQYYTYMFLSYQRGRIVMRREELKSEGAVDPRGKISRPLVVRVPDEVDVKVD